MQVDYPITTSYRNSDNAIVTQTAILKANLDYNGERNTNYSVHSTKIFKN
jgi:hypothetical protein